ncbi:glycosyltransferase [Candidatus Moduliflexota bacterium]
MRILALPYTHTLSHTSRPLLVAQELRKRGHEVVFAGESPKKSFIVNEGFSVLPLYEPDPEKLFGNIRKGKLRFASDAEVQRMIEADLVLYKDVEPDVVLSDGRFSAPVSTQISGLRHTAIVNVSSTAYRSLPYIPLFDWIPEIPLGHESRFRRVSDRLNLRLEMSTFNGVMNVFTRLRRKYGLDKPVTATNCLCGNDLTLMADIPEYFPTRNLPSNYHYIGPITWRSSLPPPPWWPPAKGAGPLIYVTMGTTGIENFFERVHKSIARSDMTGIVTTGGHASSIKTLEGKVYVEDYIDGDLAIEKCDMVVCHGGNGTVYQALGHGTPVIGIPTNPDQKFNMRRVEALGVGKTLSWKEFLKSPSRLLDLVRSVLDEPSFCRNAQSFRDILRRHDAQKSAANLIERYFS